MGMAVSFDLRGHVPDADVLLAEAVAWLHRVDATFSTYRPDSPVSLIRAGRLALDDAPDVVRWIVARCHDLEAATDGYFDAWADGRLDPSGLVKGWAVDVVSERLWAGGARSHCVNAGGDVRVRGGPTPGTPWTVGIAHPLVRDALCAVVELGDGGVATSGTAERGAHIVDPRTGRAALDLASVTVIGPDLASADAYATAALARGLSAPGWLGGLAGYEAYVVDAGGNEWASAGWPAVACSAPG